MSIWRRLQVEEVAEAVAAPKMVVAVADGLWGWDAEHTAWEGPAAKDLGCWLLHAETRQANCRGPATVRRRLRKRQHLAPKGCPDRTGY